MKCFAEKEDEFGFPSKSTGTTVWYNNFSSVKTHNFVNSCLVFAHFFSHFVFFFVDRPSALLLCKYLVSNDDLIRNKTIVELGCGTGANRGDLNSGRSVSWSNLPL